MKIQAAYQAYAAYFLDPAIQANIRSSKEEQFQEGFLWELFVKVFGYTLNPSPNYNLITEKKNVFPKLNPQDILSLPIFASNLPQMQLGEKAKKMQKLHSELSYQGNRFLKRLSDNFNIKTNSVLADFYKLDFKQFLTELKKQKVSLTLKQQDEWESYFDEYKSECNKLAEEIQATDEEIDRRVYELYGLNEEEIKLLNK
ncbi:MAG: hypothetical protein LBM62_09435 [Mediterranea sp.]|jgi:hypothetical protein|nr:hypothetical protein [Mediterranea sp.]